MKPYTGYCGYCGFIVFGFTRLSAERVMLDHVNNCHPDKSHYGLVPITREEWYDFVKNRNNSQWWHDLRNSVHSLPDEQEYSCGEREEEIFYIA